MELLKYLSGHVEVLRIHLQNVELQQEKQIRKQKQKERGRKLTFFSKSVQNKLINIIGNELTREISKMVQNCRALALIADTTPDINKHQQLSLCIGVVSKLGKVCEHLLLCRRATSNKAQALYETICFGLEQKEISFDNLVAQTYDVAANMSGQYNGLQKIIKENVGENVIFTHRYAHTLNLVLSDTATTSL